MNDVVEYFLKMAIRSHAAKGMKFYCVKESNNFSLP